MKKKIQLLFIVFFILINGIIGVQTVFNNQEKSTLEKRSYTRFSDALKQDPLHKEFYDEVTTAFTDQVEYRESFIKQYYTLTNNVFHLSEIGDVAIGKEHVLFNEAFVPKKNITQDIEKIATLINQQANEIAKNGSQLIYINYPRKDAIMTNYLPTTYNNYHDIYQQYDQLLKNQLNDNVIYVNLMDILKDSDQTYYYAGDHHLNIKGQEELFQYLNSIMKGNQNPIHTLNDYQIEKVKMKTSFNRQIGYTEKEPLEDLYLYPKGWEYNYTRYENGQESDLDIMLKTKEYTCFMAGDNAETKIVNHNATSDFKLLISGTSYLNSLEYLYIPSVSSFVSLDYRHNESGKTLIDYVKEVQPQYVLYSASSSVSSYDYANHCLQFGLSTNEEITQ